MSDVTHSAIAPVDLIFSGEFEIGASPDQAWPHVLNYPAWQNFPIVETVSGTPGEEGEVVLLKKETDGYTIGPYLARTLKLDHAKHIVVWKVYLEPETHAVEGLGGALSVQGNVEFRLRQEAGRTIFWYDLIYEYLVPYHKADDLDAFRKKQFEDWHSVFEANWPKLRQLIQTGVASPIPGV